LSGNESEKSIRVPLFKRSKEQPSKTPIDRAVALFGDSALDLETNDLVTLLAALDAGAGMEDLLDTVHWVYAPRREAGEMIAREAIVEGFAADVREPLRRAMSSQDVMSYLRQGGDEDSLDDWAIVCSRSERLDPVAIEANRKFFEELAGKVGGNYDGWEVAISAHPAGEDGEE
jgi:hypothetical protein